MAGLSKMAKVENAEGHSIDAQKEFGARGNELSQLVTTAHCLCPAEKR